MRFGDGNEVSWAGSATASGDVVDGVATMTLPSRAPGRHLDPSNRKAPVTYAVFARSVDEEGKASAYVGVGSATVTYLPIRTDGNGRGWYVTSYDQDGELDYGSTDVEIEVSDAIEPTAEVNIVGTKGELGEPSDFEYRIGMMSDEGPIVGWTTVLEEEWNLSFSGAVDLEPSDDMGFLATIITPAVYLDEDQDKEMSAADPVVGSLCSGADPIVAVQVGVAYNPSAAWAISDAGFGTGWGIYAMREGVLQHLNNPETLKFPANANCADAVENAYNEGEGQ
ncbi:MAG: hypothetical protein FJ090_14375 [Deltaproteobacteria bacterium]|nr:hypothetical protein [Deltaproteobacteria bacterium]